MWKFKTSSWITNHKPLSCTLIVNSGTKMCTQIMNKTLWTNQLVFFESSKMRPIKYFANGHLRCTFWWVIYSIVGCSIFVKGIKLHVKSKQKKTCSEYETKRYIKRSVHIISKVSKMRSQSGGINFCHLFYIFIPVSTICVTLGCTS